MKITSVKDVDNIGAYLSAYLGDVPLKDYDKDKINPFTPIKEVKGKEICKRRTAAHVPCRYETYENFPRHKKDRFKTRCVLNR